MKTRIAFVNTTYPLLPVLLYIDKDIKTCLSPLKPLR
nr:MAG TPA: hypothetical protein [Caudoviricetes sp.]